MSLVGSLEDLALGDILQIVSLSRKSGLLLLRANTGEGRIVLSDGLVCAAYVKGESEDLRGLLVGGGFVPGSEFDRCAQLAAESGRPLEEVLGERTDQACERIDSLRREHLERSVLTMFTWRTGEFSFEVREEIAERDRELMLRVGMNAQYLTMEATRLGDEGGADAGDTGPGAHDGEVDDDDFLFSGEEASHEDPEPVRAGAESFEPVDRPRLSVEEVIAAGDEAYAVLLDGGSDADGDATETLGLASAQQADRSTASQVAPEPALERTSEPTVEPTVEPPLEPPLEPEEEVAPAEPTPAPVTQPDGEPRVSLVVVDPELAALEWIKMTLAERFLRVHIFQHVDGGVDRIRQYLAHSERPLVLLSTQLAGVMPGGEEGLQSLLGRLKALAPGMPVVLLQRDGSSASGLAGADGRIGCPASYELADRRRWSRLEDAVATLRREIAPWEARCRETSAPRAVAPTSPGRAAPVTEPEPGLTQLRRASERLRDPSFQGDVLSLVLEFAADCFNRVAIFMLRDDVAVGIAQTGLERAGGPGDRALQEIEIAAEKPAWFRDVIDRRQAVRSAPTETSNRRLTELLGTAIPAEAYVAPIESGGRVAALLYADNLPDEATLPDSTALEIVLHEAGLALDRALLERALEDPDEDNARESDPGATA